MFEVWRPVEGWESYEVSNYGRLRRGERIVAGAYSGNGYLANILSDGKRRRNASRHVLVAAAFIGPRPAGHHVAHLDGDKTNNVLPNLRYVSATENNRHKRIHGTMYGGQRHHSARLTPEQVEELRRLVVPGSASDGYLAHARRLGVAVSTVCRAVKGSTWSANERGLDRLR